MDKQIKVKYTDSYKHIQIKMHKHNFYRIFERNKWSSVPERVVEDLLKIRSFVTESDLIFNPAEFKKADLKVGIKRFGAYGDLLQLLPVIRYLKQNTNNHYYLITNPQYIQDFKEYGIFVNVVSTSIDKKLFDKIVYLDGVPESDHSITNHERLMHRIKIFEDFFKISIPVYDFNVNILNEHKEIVDEVLMNAILQQY